MARFKSNGHPWIDRFYNDRNFQFWVWQFIGWFGLSLVSFFSLNIWYNQPDVGYIAHNLFQSALGAVMSLPLRTVYRRIWNFSPLHRFILSALAVFVVATAWAAIRLEVFMMMTGESGLWPDFGGWLFPSIFIFLCWTALYYGIKYFWLAQDEHAQLIAVEAQQQQEQLKRLRAESTAREAELKMLRYQINPHFLFNTLNSVSSLVQCGEAERANRMIGQLSGFLRYTLDSELLERVTLKREIEVLSLYLSIEQTRFSDRLRIEIDVEPDAAEQKIPSLLLQPLVENAIKYAVAPSESGASIRVRGAIVDGELEIVVQDSGSGGSGVSGTPGGLGVGLRNTRERLRALYGASAQMDQEVSAEGGFTVRIRIPADRPPSVVQAEDLQREQHG